MSSRIFSPIRT